MEEVEREQGDPNGQHHGDALLGRSGKNLLRPARRQPGQGEQGLPRRGRCWGESSAGLDAEDQGEVEDHEWRKI